MLSFHDCLFCGDAVRHDEKLNDLWFGHCECTSRDGFYSIARDLYDDLSVKKNRLNNLYLISGYLREMYLNGQQVKLTYENIDTIFNSPMIPSTIVEKIDKVLLYLYKKMSYLGERVRIGSTSKCYNIAYSPNENEFTRILDYLKQKNFIVREDTELHLTVDGIDYVQKLQQSHKNTNQCFIAMSFDKELLSNFKSIVFPKIQETGFYPVTVDQIHHNDDIADRIIYEIKQSQFVIADFTEQKHGVYFEAGYAKGLGLEVIWTVSKSDIEKCHFDTNHYNHIVWDNYEELAQKLQDRILATIPNAQLQKILPVF